MADDTKPNNGGREVMRLELSIDMDNAAFKNHAGYEAARILDTVCERLRDSVTFEDGDRITMHDYSGNGVGVAVIKGDE